MQPKRPTPQQRARRAWLAALMLAAAGAAASGAAQAQLISGADEAERENLTQIAHEIERVQALVVRAGQNAPTGQRVKFRYDWLEGDLQMLKQGVEQHLDAPRQPRPIPPLRGDYRQ